MRKRDREIRCYTNAKKHYKTRDTTPAPVIRRSKVPSADEEDDDDGSSGGSEDERHASCYVILAVGHFARADVETLLYCSLAFIFILFFCGF